MLTDDLKDVFRERAMDINAEGISLLADLEARLSRHRRRRPLRALLATGVVAAVVVASVVVSVQLTRSGPSPTSNARTNDVPCATPTRMPTNYVAWPCANGPVSDYFREQFDHPTQFDPSVTTLNRNARVLAFGDIPASRPGGRFIVVETWNPRTLDTKLHAIFTTPAGVLPKSTQSRLAVDGIGPNDPAPAGASDGPARAAIDALIIVGGDRPSKNFATDCAARLAHIPGPRRGYLASCSDIVLARSDVTDIQVLHHGTPIGSPIPVANHFTGLPKPWWRRHGWTLEALSANGAVVDSIPWQTNL